MGNSCSNKIPTEICKKIKKTQKLKMKERREPKRR